MKPLGFTLRQRPDQRLDLSPLVPHLLAGKTAAEIEHIELQTSRYRVDVGEIFRPRMGDAEHIRIEGACDRFDHVGHGMTGGEVFVDGDVGSNAGRLMTGGRLILRGNGGPWAASGMKGGVIEIVGAADDRLGGPLAGELECAAAWSSSAAAPASVPGTACVAAPSSSKAKPEPTRGVG